MPYDQREEHLAIAEMTANAYLRAKCGYLAGILWRSRLPWLRTKWWWVNPLQRELLTHLYAVQEVVRQGRALEQRTEDLEERRRIRLQHRMNDRIASAIQMVG